MDRSLSIAQQAVQGAHASIEAARDGLISSGPHPHLVLCRAKNLQKEVERLEASGIRYRSFHESDLDGRLTAVATEPLFGDTRRRLSHLTLFGV